MKIPEPLFFIVNAIVKSLLHSPLHFILSSSVMMITFTGRKSGRTFSTPVRFIKVNGTDYIRSFSSEHGQWWRNLRMSTEVDLRIAGKNQQYCAHVYEQEPEVIRQKLEDFLTLFPQDAVYHDIRINKDKTLNADDFEKALLKAVMIEFEPI